jgi:hypothetical protein
VGPHFLRSLHGSTLGLRYGEMTALAGPRGPFSYYATYDPEHERHIVVLVASETGADLLREGFTRWCEFGGHPHVLTPYHLTESSDRSVVAVEAEPWDTSLADRLATEGALPFVEVLSIGAGVADALVAMHDRGATQGGLDASTVVVNDAGRALLFGVGISEARPGANAADVRALGALLAAALGAPGEVPDHDETLAPNASSATEGNSWEQTPGQLKQLIADLASGRVSQAGQARDRLAELFVHFTGRRRSGALPTAAQGAGPSAITDPEVSASTVGAPEAVSLVPSADWLDQHSNVARSWFDDELSTEDRVRHPAPPSPPIEATAEEDLGRGRRLRGLASAVGITVVAVSAVALLAMLRESPAGSADGVPSNPNSGVLGTSVTRPPTSTTRLQLPPAPPSDVRAEYVDQDRVRLTWTNNSSIAEGFLIRVRHYALDLDGQPEAEWEGWVGPELTLWDTPGDAVQSGVELNLDRLPGRIICLKPVAATTTGAPGVESDEQVCLPERAPTPPVVTYSESQDWPRRELRLRWEDASFTETHFRVLQIDDAGQIVQRYATTDNFIRVEDLPAGESRCYVIRAENAHNLLSDAETSVPTEGSSPPFCFFGT